MRLAAGRIEPDGFLQLGDRVGHGPDLEERLAEREVGPGERRRQVDHLPQLLDLFRRSARRAGTVGRREIELCCDGARRERHGFFELANRGLGIGWRQRRSEIGARLRVVWIETHGLAQRRDARLIVTRLNENEAEIVGRLGVVRTEAKRFAERGADVVAARASAAEQPAEQIVRLRSLAIRRAVCLLRRGARRR